MAASSEHLKVMFKSEYNNNYRNENEFHVKNINGPMLRKIIDFCYSGHIDITEDNVKSIMAAACYLRIDSLQMKCEIYWPAKLTTTNCIRLMLEANRNDRTEMWNEMLDFTSEHFESIPIDEIVQMDAQNVRALLCHDHITAPETYRFNVMVKWLQHNEKDRTKFVPSLLGCFRLKHFSEEVIHIYSFPPIMEYFLHIFYTNFSFSIEQSNHSARNTTATTVF